VAAAAQHAAQLVFVTVDVRRMSKRSEWGFDETVTKKYGCKDFGYDPT